MILQKLIKIKKSCIKSINNHKGHLRRVLLGELALDLGRGGISEVASDFNAGRDTIRKGIKEFETGAAIIDAVGERGRKRIEEKLPNLLEDIIEIADCYSQADPSLKTAKKYANFTVKELREKLIEEKYYTDEKLPTNATLNNKLNELGYILRKVQKTKPIKKIKETDAIFETLTEIHSENKDKENVVRISIDTKNKVKIGNFSRGGYSRLETQAYDHDFGDEYITPFGILDITKDKLKLVFSKSKVTADFMIDALEEYWEENNYQKTKDTLIINADNGPENNSRRTQYMKRLIEFSIKYNVKIILAYYPPYHSKYNPVERAWGVLEQYWNGCILDCEEAVLGYASNMTWKGNNPIVKLVDKEYKTGIKVDKKTMAIYESKLDRMKGLEKWFVEINPKKCKEIVNIKMKA